MRRRGALPPATCRGTLGTWGFHQPASGNRKERRSVFHAAWHRTIFRRTIQHGLLGPDGALVHRSRRRIVLHPRLAERCVCRIFEGPNLGHEVSASGGMLHR